MTLIRIPNAWVPRPYQRTLWNALETGTKRAVAVWHRRAGKDDLALHWAAYSAHKRVGTYWHMLPEAAQARKAIWDAVDPHSGRRRIEHAFPPVLRAKTNEQEMFIRFTNGSTWQVVGSDNYNSLVGSPPVGVVLSEWAIADPAAWAYLRPILAENDGWALFIYTPRGRNHGLTTYDLATSEPGWFAQRLPATETGVFPTDVLAAERRQLEQDYGRDLGGALYRQEYECSFDAATIGSVYAQWIEEAETAGRVGAVTPEPGVPVQTAWDLGFGDATAIWFFQVIGPEVRVIDYVTANGRDIAFYAETVHARGHKYGAHHLPHDAAHKILAAGGRSILEQLRALGLKDCRVWPATGTANGIQAARATLPRCWFAASPCADGISALRAYRYGWDATRKVTTREPIHDWSSHAAKAFELLARAWHEVAKDTISSIVKPAPIQYTGSGLGHIIATIDVRGWLASRERERRERL